MKRKIFRSTMLLLISFMISAGTYAQKSFDYTYQSVKFECKPMKSGTVRITGFDQNATTVVVPHEVKHKGLTYQVTEIDTYISGNNYSTISLTLEEGIQRISNFCFVEFRDLKEIVLPKSIQLIGRNAFRKNKTNIIQAPDKLMVQTSTQTLPVSHPYVSNSPVTTVPVTSHSTPEQITAPVSSSVIKPTQKVNNNEFSFAVIIANEKYDSEMPVKFALNDGRIFKEYCKSIFNMPEENIRLLENASHMQIRRTLEWLKKVANAYAGVCKIYIYYAGHGMSDEKHRNAYLLPSDGYAEDIEISGYSLHDFYNTLGSLPAESVTVFLDACFSGMKRDGKAITAARSIAIVPEEEELSGKVMVFSATTATETAYSYDGKEHGLFTYFLLKKLKQTGGRISYAELYEYIRMEVVRKSLTLNDKGQTPTIAVSPEMEGKWKNSFFINNH